MLLILIIEFTKASKKASCELANLVTKFLVFGKLSRAWSEENKLFPWRINLKYVLSKVVDEGSIVAPAFFGLFLMGHMFFKLAAKDEWSVGSMSCDALKLWILFWKDEQWENPRVCPPAGVSKVTLHFLEAWEIWNINNCSWIVEVGLPERATRSFKDRPLWEKLCWSWEMLKVGAGNCLVSVASDVLPSFLPFGTFQLGPPDCRINYTIRKCMKFSLRKYLHTLMKQSWKCIRSSAAGTVLSLAVAFLTALETRSSTLGQLLS